jgi:hypothetical protein
MIHIVLEDIRICIQIFLMKNDTVCLLSIRIRLFSYYLLLSDIIKYLIFFKYISKKFSFYIFLLDFNLHYKSN